MFENVGKKIMALAKINGVAWLILGIMVWSVYLTNDYSQDNTIGWIALLVGVSGFLTSWPLYGFGQMVDDVNAMRRVEEKTTEIVDEELPEL